MEDDDEFGDLYTDVLRQFQPPEPPNDPSPKPLIDLNLHTHDDDNDEFLFPAPNPNPNPIPKFNPTLSHRAETLVLNSTSSIPEPVLPQSSDLNRDSKPEVVRDDGLAEASASGVLESGGDGKPHEEVLNPGGRSGFELVLSERGGKDDSLVEKNEDLIDEEENFDKFDIEEAEEPVIPGVSDHGGGGNDWDSDSDDDLKIVLNESNHGDVLMDGLGGRGDEDDEDDDDDDPLVIVAGSEPGIVPMEDREWGEDAGRVADGERKELGEATKVNGGAVVAPKIGFNGSFTYQPYHSQFKYVRPGTAPIPGPVPVGIAGVPGQVRPPVNIGPVGGFGRGDWRPTGIRNTFPMQKNMQPGFGMNVWGNNTAGRGFGSGLDFTLPSHKTIFEVDVDSFEEKPWRLPGLDMSDFFNFGLNEGSWKDYCKQLEQLRLETTMQSKIRVYESGRTEQVYDPDLPPELAAAAGIRDISSENANTAKLDGGQIDIAKGSQDVRPPLPIGRAIQVETSSVERLPSTDTRPLRIRDSDVIIEIVLEGSTNDASLPGNNVTEKLENEPLSENFRGGQESNGDIVEQQSGGRKKEMVGRRVPFINSIHDEIIEEESLLPHRPDSREHSSSYPGRDVCTLQEERKTKVGACDRSPIMTRSGSTVDKGVTDNLKEDSVESIGGKRSDQFSSPATVGSTEEPDFEHRDGLHGSSVMSDGKTFTDTHASEKPLPSVKKQNLSSPVEQSSDQAIADEGGIRAARSRENSKARSDSSRDYHRLRDSIDEEVVQHGRSTRMGNLKRPRGEDEPSVRRKSRDERHEVEKHRMVGKGWEDSHSRRDWDPHLARQSHMKTEGIDKRKEREISEGVWLQRDDDPHGRRARAEDTRNKVREREKMDKDEHLQSRKQLDNGNSRGYHDKDVASRPRERDDSLKSQYESRNDHYTKRRKEEDYLRRGGEKEEILHNHRDNPSRRKRERDDALDSRKRDDQVRIREDTYNSARHKEDDWIHRERDQMHRIKQSHEESLLKREREERREGVRRSGRAAEEKIWVPVPHARVKDEYKGTSDTDYQFKDTNRHNEQLTRRVEDGSLSQHRGREDFHSTRGSQHSKDERRSRQEREGTRRDLLVGGSDNNRVHEKKRKDNSRRSKDSEGGDGNSVGPSSRTQEDQSGHMNERAILNGTTEQGKHIENASSDEELRDSRRGRSKLERWTSHKGRDFTINSKSSSSTMKVKEIDKYENGASKLPEESSKTVENIDDQHPLGDQKGDQNNVRSVNGRHSETAEKLKQRSERFKLPMPNDKEAPMIKNMENEPLLPSAQSGAHEDPEIKPERPPRKRRWISN